MTPTIGYIGHGPNYWVHGSPGITDARALYDLFHRRSGAAGLCRRAQIDVSVMAASAQILNYWIPGIYMLADCLTKRIGNSTLMRKVMVSGLFALQPEPLKLLVDTASDAPSDGCRTYCSLPESVSAVCVAVHL